MSGRDRLDTFPLAEVGDLSQHYCTIGSAYPAPSKLCILLLLLCSHKEASKLLCCYPTGTRSAEWVEDEVALFGRGQKCAAEETQGLLGGMISVKLLLPWHGRDVPDRGDLCFRISAVYEVVVEGVARSASLSGPQQRFVGVGEGGVECVRGRVWLSPGNLVYELEFHRLQGETEAEDDVVRAGDPDGAIRFEDAARLLQPPDVEPVILSEPH